MPRPGCNSVGAAKVTGNWCFPRPRVRALALLSFGGARQTASAPHHPHLPQRWRVQGACRRARSLRWHRHHGRRCRARGRVEDDGLARAQPQPQQRPQQQRSAAPAHPAGLWRDGLRDGPDRAHLLQQALGFRGGPDPGAEQLQLLRHRARAHSRRRSQRFAGAAGLHRLRRAHRRAAVARHAHAPPRRRGAERRQPHAVRAPAAAGRGGAGGRDLGHAGRPHRAQRRLLECRSHR